MLAKMLICLVVQKLDLQFLNQFFVVLFLSHCHLSCHLGVLRLNQHLTKSPFSNDFSDLERGSLNYAGLFIMVTIIGKLQIFGTCVTDKKCRGEKNS